MKKWICLALAAMFLCCAGCGLPSREALAEQGVYTEEYSDQGVRDLIEKKILSGESELAEDFYGELQQVEASVRKTLRDLSNGSFIFQRFGEGYNAALEEKQPGVVATAISWELQDEELLLEMPRNAADDSLLVTPYSAQALDQIVRDMADMLTPTVTRLFTWEGAGGEEQPVEGLSQAIQGDFQMLSEQNCAYVALVESGSWEITDWNRDGFFEMELTLNYLPTAEPLREVPVAHDGREMVEALLNGFESGRSSVVMVLMEDMPLTQENAEETLFGYINAAETNAGTLACEATNIWQEIYWTQSNQHIGRFWLEYSASLQEIEAAQAELKAAIAERGDVLLAQEYADEKAAYRAVYDLVLDLAKYDKEIQSATLKKKLTPQMCINRSAYGVLVSGKTVCTGYARAFKALCDYMDLPCWAVNGKQDGEGHAWNAVRIGEEVLYVDCTFADTGGSKKSNFLFTQEQLKKRHYVVDEGFVMKWE
ncbi:MAG: hypothetical protein LBN26_09080 [Christensenellaceae bacterium]|jgi:hypothetical protein|nr:hypothetical protein [Christensenellaceae bacterium]